MGGLPAVGAATRGLKRCGLRSIIHLGTDRAGQPTAEAADGPVGPVHCEEFLGGLLKSYHRAAA